LRNKTEEGVKIRKRIGNKTRAKQNAHIRKVPDFFLQLEIHFKKIDNPTYGTFRPPSAAPGYANEFSLEP